MVFCYPNLATNHTPVTGTDVLYCNTSKGLWQSRNRWKFHRIANQWLQWLLLAITGSLCRPMTSFGE